MLSKVAARNSVYYYDHQVVTALAVEIRCRPNQSVFACRAIRRLPRNTDYAFLRIARRHDRRHIRLEINRCPAGAEGGRYEQEHPIDDSFGTGAETGG